MAAGYVADTGNTDGRQEYRGSYHTKPRMLTASSSSSSYSHPSSSSSRSTQRSMSTPRPLDSTHNDQRPALSHSSESLTQLGGPDTTMSGQGSDSDKRRQRIQQACKSCGAKRVKCDGQLPCNTCLRTGDQCEYGRPKKRGPPKGSSRAAPKRLAQDQLQPPQTPQHWQTSHYVKSPHGNFDSGSGGSSHGLATKRTLPRSPSHSSRIPLRPSGHGMQPTSLPPSASVSADPRFSSPHNSDLRILPHPSPSAMPLANMVVQRLSPSSRPLPQLPTSSTSAFERPSGSYGILPIPIVASQSTPFHSKFRGGSSGIVDLPRLVRSDASHIPGPRYWPDSETVLLRTARRSSPASFALEPAAMNGKDSSAPASDYNIQEGTGSPLAHDRTEAPSSPDANTDPNQHSVGEIAAVEDSAAEGVFCDTMTGSNSQLHEPKIPLDVEDRVSSIYWGIVFPHWPMLVKRMLPMVNGQPRIDQQANPLLHNAVFSLAACVWDLQRDGPLPAVKQGEGNVLRALSVEELSAVYFTRARYWLARIDNDSSIETAQALLCMSLRESGCGRSTQSAHYAMSACRVALDLGLQRHIPMTDTSPDENQTRLRLWWCIYSLDKLNAAQLGRPCVLRFIETDTPLPEVDHPDEKEILEPLEDPSSASLAGQPMRAISGLLYSSQLALILEEILQQYNLARPKTYPPATVNAVGLHRHPCARLEAWDVAVGRLNTRLDKWYESLPSSLQIQSVGPTWPHILCQHIWACALRIILHRPHILRPAATQTGLPDSHRICTQSALELCRLVALYKEDHGVKRLSGTISYCVFTAASILLANCTSPDGETATEARSSLKECCAILGLIGGTWSNAGVHLSILRRLGQSIDADLQGTGLEMQSVGVSSSTKAALAHLLHPNDNASIYRGPSEAISGLHIPSSQHRNSKDGKTVGATFPLPRTPQASESAVETTTASTLVLRSTDGLPDDVLSALQDEHYWSRMPLSSENVTAWEMFTKSYLEER